MKKLLTLLLVLVVATGLWAHDFEVDGIYYNNRGNSQVTVTYRDSTFDAYLDEYKGHVHIPASVTCNGNTYEVVAIGHDAFKACSALSGVTLPNSITTIDLGAFEDCNTLSEVELPNSLTSIGSLAFQGCSSLKSITLPSSVVGLCPYVFESCTSLENVTILNSEMTVGLGCFDGCTQLKQIHIPKGSKEHFLAMGLQKNGVQLVDDEMEDNDATNTIVEMILLVVGLLLLAFCINLLIKRIRSKKQA
jgi:hypothetical protein